MAELLVRDLMSEDVEILQLELALNLDVEQALARLGSGVLGKVQPHRVGAVRQGKAELHLSSPVSRSVRLL